MRIVRLIAATMLVGCSQNAEPFSTPRNTDSPKATAQQGSHVEDPPFPDVKEAPMRLSKQPVPDVPSAELLDFVRRNNEFAFEFFGQVRKAPGNLVFAPNCLSTTMAMVYAGAKGDTARGIERAMRFPSDAGVTLQLTASLSQRLQAGDGTGSPFQSANALWFDTNIDPMPAYRSLLTKTLAPDFRTVDFFENPGASCKEINKWVSSKTNNRIPSLLTPNDVVAAHLVITNAIAFDGNWAFPFDPKKTKPKPFTLASGGVIQAETMTHDDLTFRYHQGATRQIFQIPMRQQQFSFVIVMPTAGSSLAKLESELTAADLDAAVLEGKLHDGSLSLPKFQTATARPLRNDLIALGMEKAFSESDFSALYARSLEFRSVQHSSTIVVDETGARAAGATAAIFGISSHPAISATIDRPFLYFLIHDPTKAIVMNGRLADPTAK